MKIKELIQKLEGYNQDADITLTTSEDICISYISRNSDGETLTEQTTNQVFIEPEDICPFCTSEYMNGDEMWCSSYNCACRDVEECYQYERFDER